MPTATSNAVGTARQFTPQPDATYQGRYRGLNVGGVSPDSTSGTEILATNMARLDAALQGYAVQHEKYLDAKGHDEAEQMINGMTPAAIQSLNTIDAAQIEGYADSTANPYFRAYAEKLRGGFLSAKMKQEYDAKFSMSPSQSMDEEAKRYSTFASEWRDVNLSGDKTPANRHSFDTGFNENQLVNVNNLATSWNKRKNEEDILVTMASTQSKLGGLIENSVELLETNGALTAAGQTVFNEARLMGLPSQYRQKLLSDWANDLIKTGHIDAARLEQMLDNITIQTSMDGSTTRASDMLDVQTLKTAAEDFNLQFMTQAKYDTMQKFIKTKDRQGFLAYLEATRKNAPDKAREVESMWSAVDGGIRQKEAEEQAIAKAKLRAASSAQKASFKRAQGVSNTIGVVEAWENGSDTYNGQPISSYSLKAEELYPVIMRNMQAHMTGEESMGKLTRLMALPQANALRSSITSHLVSEMDSLRLSDDGTPVVSETLRSSLQFYSANPNSAEHLFGADVGKRARTLKTLVDMQGGDFEVGLQQFAVYNSVDKEVRDGYKTQIKDLITSTNYAADYVPHLGGGLDSIAIYGNPDMMGAVQDLATVLCCQGSTPYQALNKAGSIIQDNYFSYHWGGFPKGVLNDIGTPDDEGYMQKALDDAMYSVSDGDAAYTTLRYDRNSQTFLFTDGNTGKSSYKSLSYIRRAAKERFDKDADWAENNPQASQDYAASVEGINKQRARDDLAEGWARDEYGLIRDEYGNLLNGSD